MIFLAWITCFFLSFGICQVINDVNDDYKNPYAMHPRGNERAYTWTLTVENVDRPTRGQLSDWAEGYYAWVTEQDYHEVGEKGACLVSLLFVPEYPENNQGRPSDKGLLFVSTIPRGTWNQDLIQNAPKDAAAWWSKVEDHVNDNGWKTHAEDSVYCLYEGLHGEVWDGGKYPYGSIILTYGQKYRDDPDGAQEVHLCLEPNQTDVRNPTCQKVARDLGVDFGETDPQGNPRNPLRTRLEDLWIHPSMPYQGDEFDVTCQ